MEFPEGTAMPEREADQMPKEETALQPEAATQAVECESKVIEEPVDKASLLNRLRTIAASDGQQIDADEVGRIKRQFYSLENEASKANLDTFIQNGGNAEDYVEEISAEATEFKTLLAEIKEKKTAERERINAQLQQNSQRKRAIIDELMSMSADTDNVNRHHQHVKELQAEFKSIGDVPQEEVTELWKQYTAAVEHFYDQWKVNKELRDYDFKKNLSEKQLLLTEAEALGTEADVITAFKRLQDLHQKWREIGPVAKEIREEIWNKFKDASAIINKRYQTFFEEKKARERENEDAKTALCERIEAIDIASINSFAAWNDVTKQIIEAQEEWKKLGFASRKMNNTLFTRFRATCDKFFAAKAEYFKGVKNSLTENLAKKTALCEQAEALKDSTEWRKTTDKIVQLQKEWKTIGAVPKKQSDAVWHRFMDACDHFFEQKKKSTSDTRKTEQTNLKAKQAIVARLKELNAPECTAERKEAIAEINTLRESWQQTGHVPFREKDKLHDEYRQIVGELFDKYDIRENRARMATFESSIEKIGSDSSKLMRERERLMRAYEQRRTELKTYENNMGFFNSKSKSGEQIVHEMERKMQRIRQDLTDIEQKIAVIDSKLG